MSEVVRGEGPSQAHAQNGTVGGFDGAPGVLQPGSADSARHGRCPPESPPPAAPVGRGESLAQRPPPGPRREAEPSLLGAVLGHKGPSPPPLGPALPPPTARAGGGGHRGGARRSPQGGKGSGKGGVPLRALQGPALPYKPPLRLPPTPFLLRRLPSRREGGEEGRGSSSSSWGRDGGRAGRGRTFPPPPPSPSARGRLAGWRGGSGSGSSRTAGETRRAEGFPFGALCKGTPGRLGGAVAGWGGCCWPGGGRMIIRTCNRARGGHPGRGPSLVLPGGRAQTAAAGPKSPPVDSLKPWRSKTPGGPHPLLTRPPPPWWVLWRSQAPCWRPLHCRDSRWFCPIRFCRNKTLRWACWGDAPSLQQEHSLAGRCVALSPRCAIGRAPSHPVEVFCRRPAELNAWHVPNTAGHGGWAGLGVTHKHRPRGCSCSFFLKSQNPKSRLWSVLPLKPFPFLRGVTG